MSIFVATKASDLIFAVTNQMIICQTSETTYVPCTQKVDLIWQLMSTQASIPLDSVG
jgi:hypothetical protein